MNIYTAYSLTAISIIILTAFVFYLTGNNWTFALLFLIPKIRVEKEY